MFHTCVPINAFSLRLFLTFLPFEHFNISNYFFKNNIKKKPTKLSAFTRKCFLSFSSPWISHLPLYPQNPPCTPSQITLPSGTGPARFRPRIVTSLKYNISQPVRAGRKGFLAFSELQIPFPIRKILLLLCYSLSHYTHVHTHTYIYIDTHPV